MRILSLHPAATEALFAIGAGDMIVGRTDACDYPEHALMIPSAGSEFTRLTAEVFEPGLIVLGPGQDALRTAFDGYKVVLFAPTSVEDIGHELGVLGELLGKAVEVGMVMHDMHTLLVKVEERAARFKRVRVYCETDAPYAGEIVTAAGGEPFTGEPTTENILAFNPHIILASKEGEDESYLERMAARDGWHALHAIRDERTFWLPASMLRPGPRLHDGIRRIARILHGIEA